MAKMIFSPKEAIAEAANNILKAYLIAIGSDQQTASMFGETLSGVIKGIGIEVRKPVKGKLDAAIKSAWVDIFSRETFESLSEDCKTALQHEILSANTAIQDLNAESPVNALRERIRPVLQKYTGWSDNDIYNYAGNMSQQLIFAVNDEIKYEDILTLLDGIEQLKNGLSESRDMQKHMNSELRVFFQELMERLSKIEAAVISNKEEENLYKQLMDVFAYERKKHPSIRMMDPNPSLFPKGLPEIRSDKRNAVENDESPRSIKDMILDSWKREDHRHILLVGEGGIGKTIAMLTLPEEDWFKAYSIPAIYIPLQRMDELYEGKLNNYIRDNFNSFYSHIIDLGNRIPVGHPHLLLLLDGFNEVPDKYKETVSKSIREWMRKPGIQIITTSRLGFSLENHFSKYLLQPLAYDTIKSFLLSAGIKKERLPQKNARIWKIINVPLMLAMYTQIDKVKEIAENSSVFFLLEWKEPDNSAHIVWNYLQMELYRCIERACLEKPDTLGSPVQYAVVVLIIAPYICAQMSHRAKFFLKHDGIRNEFKDIICDALNFYFSHQWLLSQQMLNIRQKYDRNSKAELFKPEMAEYYAELLINHIALFQEQENFDNNKNLIYTYSLAHQNFRDALAAFFICSSLTKISDSNEKTVLLDYADYYVKNYIAEFLSDEEIIMIWDLHRNEEPEDGHITWILLDIIGRQRKYDYRKLDFSRVDLTKTNLYRLFSKRLDICPLPSDKNKFNLTKIALRSFLPNGHIKPIYNVEFSADGRKIVSESYGENMIWDLESGKSRRVRKDPSGAFFSEEGMIQIWNPRNGNSNILDGHSEKVNSVVFNTAGEQVAIGLSDNIVQIWDLKNGKYSELRGQLDSIKSVAFSSDAKLAVVESRLQKDFLRVYDIESGKSHLMQNDSGSIEKVRFSSDSNYVIVQSYRSLIVWDLKSNKCRKLQGLDVHSLKFSPDARYVIINEEYWFSNNADYRSVWDIKNGDNIFQDLSDVVKIIAFSQSGKYIILVLGDYNNRVMVVNLLRREYVLDVNADIVDCVAFSPDEKHVVIVSGLYEKSVRVWDLKSREYRELKDYSGTITCLAFSPDGSMIVSGSNDRAIRVWDLESGRSRVIPGHTGEINSVKFSPDGRQVASGSSDRTVRIWDLESGEDRVLQGSISAISSLAEIPEKMYRKYGLMREETREMQGLSGSLYSIICSPDGKQIAFSSYDRTIRIWNLEQEESHVLQGHSGWINSIAFSWDGKLLASGSNDSTVRIWDLENGECRILGNHSDWIKSVAFSYDGKYLACGSSDNTVCIWNLESGKSRVLIEQEGWINSIAFSPNGRLLACGSSNNTLLIWDLLSQECRVLKGHTGWINSVAFSPDGRQVVSGSWDKTVRIWDLKSGRSIVLKDNTGRINNEESNPAESQIAGSFFSKKTRFWELEHQESHLAEIRSVIYSPDGRQIASGSDDGTVRIWDLVNKKNYAMQIYSGSICSITFILDGRQLACALNNGEVYLWDLYTNQHVKTISTIPHINLCGANLELAIIDDEDKGILKKAGAKL